MKAAGTAGDSARRPVQDRARDKRAKSAEPARRLSVRRSGAQASYETRQG
jgi:hypothetical protein